MNKYSATVMVCEAEIEGYLGEFPGLQRLDVLRALVDSGPWRDKVEAELARIHLRSVAAERAPAMRVRRAIEKPIHVIATWNEEAKVWVAESEQVPGLAAEARSPDHLIEKLKGLIPELLNRKGRLPHGTVPFALAFKEIASIA
jgi:hypothetical protein